MITRRVLLGLFVTLPAMLRPATSSGVPREIVPASPVIPLLEILSTGTYLNSTDGRLYAYVQVLAPAVPEGMAHGVLRCRTAEARWSPAGAWAVVSQWTSRAPQSFRIDGGVPGASYDLAVKFFDDHGEPSRSGPALRVALPFDVQGSGLA